MRLGKAGEPVVHQALPENLRIGTAISLKEGDVLTLISTGNMLDTAMQTAALLKAKNISAGVVSMPTVKPLDDAFLHAEARRVPFFCVLEEHARYGGLGECIALHVTGWPDVRTKILSIAVGADIASGLVGSQQQLRQLMQMDPPSLTERISQWLSLFEPAGFSRA